MLPDPNFARTVVLLCEHNDDEGTFGLSLTRPLTGTVGDVIDTLAGCDSRLYAGGPVQTNTLHYIHRHGDVIESSIQVQDGLAWGGDFDLVQALVLAGDARADTIRFFAGYSGWGPGQLKSELEQGSWIVSRTDSDTIFTSRPEDLWKTVLRGMGGQYKILSNFPLDPRLN
jgi:putative transcriptional regulator